MHVEVHVRPLVGSCPRLLKLPAAYPVPVKEKRKRKTAFVIYKLVLLACSLIKHKHVMILEGIEWGTSLRASKTVSGGGLIKV